MIDPVMPKLTGGEKAALHRWDPDKELRDWATTAATQNIRFEDLIIWNGYRKTGCFHASEVNKSCDMYFFLERLKSPRIRKRRFNAMILNIGTAGHKVMDYVQTTKAEFEGYAFRYEYPVNPTNSKLAATLHLCGSIDGLSTDWPLKHRSMIWDYKTIGLKSFGSLRKPAKSYIQQLHVYMACLSIPVAALTYIVKDNAQLLTFLVFFDDTIWAQLRQRFIKINTLVTEFRKGKNVSPEQTIGQSCYYCDFYEECKPPIPAKIKKTKSSGLPAI